MSRLIYAVKREMNDRRGRHFNRLSIIHEKNIKSDTFSCRLGTYNRKRKIINCSHKCERLKREILCSGNKHIN